jgi:hypothetical protein
VNEVFLLVVPFWAGVLEYFPTIPNPVGIPAVTPTVFELLSLVTFIVLLLATLPLPVRSSSGWRPPQSFSELR